MLSALLVELDLLKFYVKSYMKSQLVFPISQLFQLFNLTAI